MTSAFSSCCGDATAVRIRRPIRTLGLVPAGVLLLLIQVTQAAEPKTFLNFEVGESWTDNTLYSEGAGRSDASTDARFGVLTSFQRPTRSVDLNYRTKYSKYRDFSEFDDFEHLLALDYGSSVNARTVFSSSLSYFRTQSQTIPVEFDPDTLFLTERSRRETIRLDLGVAREVSETWNLSLGAGASQLSIEPVSGIDTGITAGELGDQRRFEAAVEGTKQLSATKSWTFGYQHKNYDLDLGEDEQINSVGVRFTRQINPLTTVSFDAGVARRSGGVSNETGGQGRFAVGRQFERGALGFSLSRYLTNGGAVLGASTVSEAEISWSGETPQHWDWSVFSNVAFRESLEAGASDLTLLRVGTSMTYSVRRRPARMRGSLGLRMRGVWVDQTDSGGGPDFSRYVISASLVARLGV